jgi:predicted aminopeptidase
LYFSGVSDKISGYRLKRSDVRDSHRMEAAESSTQIQGNHLHLYKVHFFLWIPICLAGIWGCQTVHYYSQAVDGQCRILFKRQPISDIIADSESPQSLRNRLIFILKVREFAENELQLPVHNHYLTYVDLQRPFVLWNVFAAPEFSLTPKTWCYPIAGCAAYRGYFTEKNARQYADRLAKQGYEVYVGGVTAYSTLGWFDDPVLSTFIRFSEARTAALIFHELAHQTLYVKDDTAFNESFATLVEQEGLRRWQHASGSERIYSEYLHQHHRQEQFVRLIMDYRKRLERLYRTELSPIEKRAQKTTIFSQLRSEFNHLKKNQIELAAYDDWMNHSLNNAKISSVVAYHDFLPAFQEMLKQNMGKMNQFFEACRQLALKSKPERHQILESYLVQKE